MESGAIKPSVIAGRSHWLVLASFSILFLAASSLPLAAQTNVNEEQGLKPYDSLHGGDLDSVSLTNGGLILHIGLVSYPQRGSLNLNFFVSYSSKGWVSKETCVPDGSGGQNCTWSWKPVFSGTEVASSVDLVLGQTLTPDPPTSDWNTSVTTPDGNQHQLGGGNNGLPVYPLRSLDGTGMYAPNNTTLILGNGTRYSYASAGGEPTSVTDANGNQITINASNGAYTDTLGRVIPAAFGTATSDLTSCPSGTSSARTWTIPGVTTVNNGARTFKLCYSNVPLQTNFQQPDITEYSDPGATSLTAIVLPDLTAWTFTYDGYGDVTGLGLPTSGSISYTYVTRNTPCSAGFSDVSLWVGTRTVNANDGTGSHTWSYTYSNGTTTVTSPDGNDTVHAISNPVTSGGGCGQYDTQVQYYQGRASGGALLKTVSTQYSGASSPFLVDGQSVDINVVPTQITTTWPGGHSSKVAYTHDSGTTDADGTTALLGSVLEKDEYDYSGSLARSTLNHYLWQDNSAYLNSNLLAPLVSTTTKDGFGNQVAQTTYGIDQYGANQPTSSGVTTGLVAPPAGGNTRGNPTTVSHWLNTTNSFISSTATYFDTGMKASVTDPMHNTTKYAYSSAFAGAYVAQTTMPPTQMPDQGAPIVQHIVSGNYDFNTGLLTSFTDENSQSYNYQYDNMLRLTQANHPDLGQTVFTYPDANTIERQQLMRSGTFAGMYTAKFDGLGRSIASLQVTPSGTVEVDTTYDPVGRAATVSNPYYQGSTHSSDPTYGVVQTQYDGLSRVLKSIKQDGSVAGISYSDNCTTTTDEAGNQRRACSDALGRMVEVDEPGDPIVSFNGAAAPATAVYSMTGFPDSYGEHDLYVGTDQHIYQLLLTSSGWVNQDLTAVTNGELAAAHSAMTSFTDSFGEHILYVGANQHLYQLFFATGSGWQNQDLTSATGNTLAALTTGLSSFADSNGEHVLYVGSNQHVNELLFVSGSGWSNQDLTAGAGNTLAAAATGFTNFADNYGEHVFYEGANQHVYQLYFSGSWTNQDLTALTGNTLAAVPTALSSLIDSYGEHVFYFGSNQHLEQLYFTGGTGWVNQDLTAATGNTLATAGSSLSSFTDSMGEHVFYAGTNQHVYSMYFSGSGWSNQDLTAMTAGTAATSGGGLASYSDGQGEHVFYDGGSQDVYEMEWSATGGWQASNVGGPSLAQNYFVTQYSYDALNNLLKVTQEGDPNVTTSSQYRVRSFTYDSLSRLLTATNPESGQMAYNYDGDGNMISKVEPMANQAWGSTQTVTVTYAYDALNRLTDKTYSDGATQNSSYRYDYSSYLGQSFQYPIGRQVAATAANKTIEFFTSYDRMGRIAQTEQCIPGVANCQVFSASYDLLGDMLSLTYPGNSFRVSYQYDAAARLTQATDSNGVIYAENPTILASGAVQEFTSPNFSNSKFHTNLNNRLQPTEIWAGSSEGSGAFFDKQYGYNPPNASEMNNGNVYTVTNVKDPTRTQSFAYDALNRLISAGDSSHWGNTYSYDAWGNLQKNAGSPAGESFQHAADANNHVIGYSYDAAGNMLNDGATSYAYDSENRITAATANSSTTTYTYDADGRRVAKSSGPNYWYGPGGEALAETDLNGNFTYYIFFGSRRLARNIPQPSPNSPDIKYYVTDHLHSTAMFVDQSGSVLDDNDFYPWGGVVPGVGKTTSTNTVKFTGKYRDNETQLDYFGARYYANALGRWMSPDWAAKPATVPYADFGDPQSLNLYAYIRNSPIVRVDADGHNWAGFDGFMRDQSAADPTSGWSSGDNETTVVVVADQPSSPELPPPSAEDLARAGIVCMCDDYKVDIKNHGRPHIDRTDKNGKLVGRYRADGSAIEHNNEPPPPIPNRDSEKFGKASEKLRKVEDEIARNNQQQVDDFISTLPGLPSVPIPDALKPDPKYWNPLCAGPCTSNKPFPNVQPQGPIFAPVPAPGLGIPSSPEPVMVGRPLVWV